MTLKEFSDSTGQGVWDYENLHVLFPNWTEAEKFRDQAREAGLEAWVGMIREQCFVFQFKKKDTKDDLSRVSRESGTVRDE